MMFCLCEWVMFFRFMVLDIFSSLVIGFCLSLVRFIGKR